MAQWITWMAQWPWVTEASHRVNKRISPLARETSRIETEPDHSSDVITSGFPFPWTKPRRGSRGAGLLVHSMDKQLEEAENEDDETTDRSSALRPPVPELGHHPTLLVRAPGTRPECRDHSDSFCLFPQDPGQCPTKYSDKFETANVWGNIIKYTLPLICGRNGRV